MHAILLVLSLSLVHSVLILTMSNSVSSTKIMNAPFTNTCLKCFVYFNLSESHIYIYIYFKFYPVLKKKKGSKELYLNTNHFSFH